MKKELKQMNQLANTFSVGSAPYRNEIDSGAFDASVSYTDFNDLPKVCGAKRISSVRFNILIGLSSV